MLLFDVNVLVNAHRAELPQHATIGPWLARTINGPQAFGISEIVLSGFVRVVTDPKVFATPSPIDKALAFCRVLRERPNAVLTVPGDRHWDIFVHLCTAVRARGNLVPDAFLAALAIESGSHWITCDRGFGRFPNLVWHDPLQTGTDP